MWQVPVFNQEAWQARVEMFIAQGNPVWCALAKHVQTIEDRRDAQRWLDDGGRNSE